MKRVKVDVDDIKHAASAARSKAGGIADAAGDRLTDAADAVHDAATDAATRARDLARDADEEADAFDLTALSREARFLYSGVLARQINRDGEIDPREIASLYLFITTLDLTATERAAVRKEVEVSRRTVGASSGPARDDQAVELARELGALVPAAARPLVLRRLVRDLMSLSHADRAWHAGEELTPLRIAALFDAAHATEIVANARKHVEETEALIAKAMSQNRLKTVVTEASAAGAGVVAPAAVYAAIVSTTGLAGAASISTTLAMLGFGGILGMTAMTTGVGTLIALGIISVEGTRYVIRKTTAEDLRRRDAFRQGLLVRHQVAIRDMADDLSTIAIRLGDAARVTAENAAELDRLRRDLQTFALAVKDLTANERRLATAKVRP